jgi:hypothetical protein
VGCCVCVSFMYWVFVMLVAWYVFVSVCVRGGVLVLLMCDMVWFGCRWGVFTSRLLGFAGAIYAGDAMGNRLK